MPEGVGRKKIEKGTVRSILTDVLQAERLKVVDASNYGVLFSSIMYRVNLTVGK